MTVRSGVSRAVALTTCWLLPTAALAHHAMDGATPASMWQGFLSGLAHPVLGVDHLAFIVGLGALAALLQLGVLLPALFIACMGAGVLAHVALLTIPGAEALVALSVVFIGLALAISRIFVLPQVVGAVFAVAGAVHGYALAESIVGAEATPLASYVAGLVIVQCIVCVAAYRLTRAVITSQTAVLSRAVPIAGLVIVLLGLYALAGTTA